MPIIEDKIKEIETIVQCNNTLFEQVNQKESKLSKQKDDIYDINSMIYESLKKYEKQLLSLLKSGPVNYIRGADIITIGEKRYRIEVAINEISIHDQCGLIKNSVGFKGITEYYQGRLSFLDFLNRYRNNPATLKRIILKTLQIIKRFNNAVTNEAHQIHKLMDNEDKIMEKTKNQKRKTHNKIKEVMEECLQDVQKNQEGKEG